MAKRTGLGAITKAAKAKEAAAGDNAIGATMTPGLNLPVGTHDLLRSVAFARAKRQGGRPSVSAIIVELVERHRAELEKEAGPFLGMG